MNRSERRRAGRTLETTERSVFALGAAIDSHIDGLITKLPALTELIEQELITYNPNMITALKLLDEKVKRLIDVLESEPNE